MNLSQLEAVGPRQDNGMDNRMMKAYALAADQNGQLQQAAACYEAVLLSNPEDLESTVNLLVLYWRIGEPARSLTGPLPLEFRSHAARRLPELLDSAAHRFATAAQIHFWRTYIAAARRGESLARATCRQLLNEHPDYLEPAFVVFSESKGTEAEVEAMRLLADYSEHSTARGRYVTSVITAALRKQRLWSCVAAV